MNWRTGRGPQSVGLDPEALLQFGSETQKQRWLPQIAAGRLKGALATVEQVSRLTPETITCEVADGHLSGRKLLVSDGNLADVFLVLAKSSSGELGLYIVEKSNQVGTSAVETIDPTRDAAQVDFTRADCEKLCDGGWQALQALYDRAAVLYAFEQLGGAQSALDMGVAYAQERYAFGRAIGSFQAIKHMLADMYVAMKLAENNCYYAAWALENDAPDLALAAATARVGATDAYQLCAKDNTQVHGGMGFTWEFDCHLYYRR